MTTPYTTAKTVLDEIAQRVSKLSKHLTQGYNMIANARAELGNLPSQYAGAIAEIDSQVAANPANDAWVAAGAEKALLVAEFQALRAQAQAQQEALEALTP